MKLHFPLVVEYDNHTTRGRCPTGSSPIGELARDAAPGELWERAFGWRRNSNLIQYQQTTIPSIPSDSCSWTSSLLTLTLLG